MKFFTQLWVVYLLAAPYTNVLNGTRFQIAEFVFLLLGAICLFNVKKVIAQNGFSYSSFKLHRLDIAIGATLCCLLLLGRSLGGCIPHLYFIAVYFLARFGLGFLSNFPEYIIKALKLLSGAIVLAALGSILLYKTGNHYHLDLVEAKYLGGIGFIPRLEAFSKSPNQLFSVASLPVLGLLSTWRTRNNKQIYWAVAALIVVVCTVSKSVPLLFVLLIPALWGPEFWYGRLAKLRILGLGLACVLILSMAKVVVIQPAQTDRNIVLTQSYASNVILYQSDQLAVYASMHLLLTQKAWQAFISSPWIGIGSGNFQNFLAEERQFGRYPVDRILYGPHSLYLGTLAQYGLSGLLSVFIFLYILATVIVKLIQYTHGPECHLWYGLALFLLLWALESWNMDTLNFRHFWWIVALLGARYASFQSPHIA